MQQLRFYCSTNDECWLMSRLEFLIGNQGLGWADVVRKKASPRLYAIEPASSVSSVMEVTSVSDC